MKQRLSILGIDLAKRIFHIAGMDDTGKIVLRKRVTREALMPFVAPRPPMVIGMEACGSAHYWARCFHAHGHTVKLIAPQFVKPYVKSNKHDPADAEAVTRPTMRFVPIKEVDQQDLQSLHRARERVVKARTALVNEIRGLGSEYGIVLPQGVTTFRHMFMATLEAKRATRACTLGAHACTPPCALRAGPDTSAPLWRPLACLRTSSGVHDVGGGTAPWTPRLGRACGHPNRSGTTLTRSPRPPAWPWRSGMLE